MVSGQANSEKVPEKLGAANGNGQRWTKSIAIASLTGMFLACCCCLNLLLRKLFASLKSIKGPRREAANGQFQLGKP